MPRVPLPPDQPPDPTMLLIREKKLGMAIARALGINRQAVSQWPEVPPKRVLVVSEIMDRPPHLIRPDLYPAPSIASDAAPPSDDAPPAREQSERRRRDNRRVTPA